MKILKYLDPYGYEVVNIGYSLDEVLHNRRVVIFRHCKPDEKTILIAWIESYRIDGTYYFGFELPRILPEQARSKLPQLDYDFIKLTRFKVDCVLETYYDWRIIEVKDYLMTTALSQPIIYKELFIKYLKPTKPVIPILVYGEGAYEIEEIAKGMGIITYNMNIPTKRKHIV
ncbi:MAG: hypothetical protein NDF57_05205 [archaeon GBS-70-058]|nr:hypothetical protein [Candidatus Culexarchaeum nevadense]